MRMIHKFIAVLTLLTLSNVVDAALVSTKITESTFNSTPKAVFDVSASSDSLFADANVLGVFYSAGSTNDTLYVWSLNYSTPTAHIKITKRTLNATSLAPKGADIKIATNITSSTGPSYYGGLGYIGFTSTNQTGDDKIDQLYFSVLAASASSDTNLTKIKLTNNTDKDVGYYVSTLWWQDSYFYLVYVAFTKSDKGIEKGLYLQGVKGDNGSLLYPSPIKVASISNPAGTTYATAGPNNSTNASMINVIYKDHSKKAIYQVAVTVSNGSVGSVTELKTDSSKIIYYPAGIISSYSTYGTAVEMEDHTTKTVSYSVEVFYNGTTSESKKLNLTTPEKYTSPSIMSFNYDSGFAIIGVYIGEKESEYVLKTFFADGSARASQEIIGLSQGGIMFFTDANGTVWAGYTDFESKNYFASKGYLGKLLA
jgi:hypothetical protein